MIRKRKACAALFAENLHTELAPGGRAGKASACSLLQRVGQGVANLAHGVDALIHGDLGTDARQSQVGAGESDHEAGNIALDAGDLHQPCDGVADQTELVCNGDGAGIGALGRRAAHELHKGGRGHPRSAAALRLAAALGARDAGVLGDHNTKGAGGKDGHDDVALRLAPVLIQGDKAAGQDALLAAVKARIKEAV